MRKKNISIGVLGSSGRMGREVVSVLEQNKSFSLAWTSSRASERGSGEDVIIDFSHRSQLELLQKNVSKKSALVSGVTGLEEKDFLALKKISKVIPTLWSPNLSIGVLWMRQILGTLNELPDDFDFSMEEFHHRNKKDAPSGTALLLAASVNQRKNRLDVKEIKSFRAGGVYGDHSVHAISQEEWITIKHQALNRAVFAKGAIKAAGWIVGKKPGLYEFKEILKAR